MGRNEAGNAAARSAKAKTVSVFGHPVPTWTVKTLAVLLAVEMAFGAWPSALANSLAFAEDDQEQVAATNVTNQADTAVTDDGAEEAAVQAEVQAAAEEILNVTEETSNTTAAGYAGTLTASSSNYNVKVEFTEAAGIAEGSSLSVKEYSEGSAAYLEAFQLVNGVEYGSDEANGLGMDAIDISLIGPDGNEFEPAAEVSVSIERSSLPEGVTSSKELSVEHLDESLGDVQVVTVAGEGVPGEVAVEDNAIVADFDVKAFSTFTVTWRNGGRTVTVHYVDESGNELDIANPDNTHPNLNANSASPAFLIYDIDGYEYSYTYRNQSSNRIYPILSKNNNNRWRYINGNQWDELSNGDDIYVVYKKKPNVTSGGTPTLKPVNPEDYPDEPSILKESKPNGDGTANLSLSITGHTKAREVEKLADVIVVFDVSGSMVQNNLGGVTRLQAAKDAVNSLVDTLAEKTDSDGNPLIRMSLISFSTSANNVLGLTDLTEDGVTSYKSAVNGLSADGGTNWEYALQLANQQAVDSGRATFVIFVTDGDPTFRKSRTDLDNSDLSAETYNGSDYLYQYYLQNNVFGQGNDDDLGKNYAAAVAEGQAIVGANKNLYTIGISESVTKVSKFNTDAGGDGAFIAANADQLNQAFEDIAASIGATLGISDIQMTDGITEMTQTVEKSGLTGTDGNFTYWKKAKDSNTFEEWDPATEGCAEAEYDAASGAVKWNMGTNFMPEDGATYKVTWKVWPSQAAYDILAKCQNDPSYYDTLTPDQKAQIVKSGNSYTLKTNEPGAGTTYKSATKSSSGITTEGETKTLPFNPVDDLSMDSNTISIQKIWDNDLDGRDSGADPIEFKVMADDTEFGTVELGPNKDDSAKNWKVDNYNISCGLMTTEDGKQVIYEKGHDFSIVEPENLAYYWDFKSDIYRPMVINNQSVMLVKVDSEDEADYTIDGGYYKISEAGAVLKATNERRSNLNISKKVVAADETTEIVPNDKFTINATVTESKGEEVWLSIQDANGDTIKDSSLVTGQGVQYQDNDGYFHCPSGTALTLTIKAGWNYRFINLHTGSTYTVEEVDPTATEHSPYVFHKLDTAASNGGTAATKSDRKAEGTIDKSNNSYSVAYTNKKTLVDLTVKKKIEGAMADMTKKFDFEVTYTVDGETKTEKFQLGHNGEKPINNLPANTEITVKETNAEGYVTTYKVTAGNATANAGSDDHTAVVKLTSDATLEFSNTMDSVVVTGIKKAVKSPITHILVVASLVAAASVAITRSRREQWTE